MQTAVPRSRLSKKRNIRFNFDSDEVLVTASSSDGVSQRVVGTFLRHQSLHPFYYFLLAGHPGERRMYDSIRNDLCWPHMANDIYAMVRGCGFSAHDKTHDKR